VTNLHAVRVALEKDENGHQKFVEMPRTEFDLAVDLVLLAMGFTGPVKEGLLTDLGVKLDPRGNVAVDENYMTNVEGVFACGDMKRGASLIVWAIREGRDTANGIEKYLQSKVAAIQ